MSIQMDPFDQAGAVTMWGEVTSIDVTDMDGDPNLVIDPAAGFNVKVSWYVDGNAYPNYLAAEAFNWRVRIFLESLGPGTDVLIGTVNVPRAATVPAGATNPWTYEAVVNVPPAAAAALEDDAMGGSGIWKVIGDVWLNSSIAGGIGDVTGFIEGPAIRVESRA